MLQRCILKCGTGGGEEVGQTELRAMDRNRREVMQFFFQGVREFVCKCVRMRVCERMRV